MPARDLAYTDKFIEDLKEFDKSIIVRVKKALLKIREKPELGKPLHGELHGFLSERVGKIRIFYFYDEKNVHLVRCRMRKEGY